MDEYEGIEDTSAGRCTAALSIAGAGYRCDLGVVHDGWAHSSRAAEAIWQGHVIWKAEER